MSGKDFLVYLKYFQLDPQFVSIDFNKHITDVKFRENKEKRLAAEKRKQPGVAFPSAKKQEHLLIIRLNLEPSAAKQITPVRRGLRR